MILKILNYYTIILLISIKLIKLIMISIFIPIRKGSKRVQNKNFRSLPGYKFGLTEIKIRQFIKFRNLIKNKKIKINFEFVVSTDCKNTINFLKNYPWIKIHIRRKKEASDDSLDKLIKIVPNICEGKYILWTHVTSPFFNHYNYLNFIKRFLYNKKYKSAFSSDTVQKFLYSKKKREWISHNYRIKKWPRTQDLELLHIANSCAFIAHREVYYKNNDRLCNNPLPIISQKNSSLDIDNYNDFLALIKILKDNLGKKNL